ncbi:DUF1707 domain-containing protein [Streptomyces sp. MST-110588]|uniref:DUF1707 SHOCT-like domain-containing protein n=1 Tax=Streptomyces sp. MST-110588 TaxID=2833628 RepID=UPI001F5DFFBA|nr:DUF1707 domain-containing protein [Streptomyces sp. MST-110588]UNO41642.1 DUF1707 domain-containing protein [Streptomyces sp. MST-110588]
MDDRSGRSEQSDRREPAIRVSDQDREGALAVLSAALSEGRLDVKEHAARSQLALEARTSEELTELTADLPAPPLTREERDRADLREWLAEWRYWLGGGVILSAIWGVQCLKDHELRFYWPLAPLGIWAAVLVAIALWPRGKGDQEKGGQGKGGHGKK